MQSQQPRSQRTPTQNGKSVLRLHQRRRIHVHGYDAERFGRLTGTGLDKRETKCQDNHTLVCNYNHYFMQLLAPLHHSRNYTGRIFGKSERAAIHSQKQEGEPWKSTARLKVWATKCANRMTTSIEQWETCARSRKKIKVATRIARGMNKGRSTRRIAFLAFTAVAMQAKGGLADSNPITFDTDSGPIGIDN
jgi:hypothetical protein